MKRIKGHIKMILLVLLVLFNTKCSFQPKNEVAEPVNLIPNDSFVQILHDMMIVESFYKSQKTTVKSIYKSMPEIADSVFNRYHIDSSRFNTSLNYYSKKPKVLKKIYEQIQDSVMLKTAQFKD